MSFKTREIQRNDLILCYGWENGAPAPYKPTPYQLALHRSKAYTRVFLGGVRTGKSLWGCMELVIQALSYPRNKLIDVSANFGQCDRNIIPHYQTILESSHIPYRLKKAYHIIEFKNGSIIYLLSADRPESILGLECSTARIDEPFLVDKEVYDNVISRATHKIGRRGIVLTGTPEGDSLSSWVYQLIFPENEKRLDLNYLIIPTADNPFIPKTIIDSMMDEYDEKLIQSRLYGKFVALNTSLALYNFDSNTHVRDCGYDPDMKLFLSVDWNVSPHCALIIQQHGQIDYIIDEIYIPNNSTTEILARQFKSKYGNHKAGLVITGDATGNSRNTKAQFSGYTDFSILKQNLGMIPNLELYTRYQIPIRDSLNLFNSRLKNARGDSKIVIDPKCKKTIRDFEVVKRNTDGTIDEKDCEKNNNGHLLDCARYYLWNFRRSGSQVSGLTLSDMGLK